MWAGGRKAASVGVRQSMPNNRKDGFSPVLSCGVLRYAHSTPDRCLSHCTPNLAACFLSAVFSVRLNRSTIPLHWGWYAVVLSFSIPRSWFPVSYDSTDAALAAVSATAAGEAWLSGHVQAKRTLKHFQCW